MEGREHGLVEKLQGLLREAAEVSLQLETAQGKWEARPHYTSIEARAHALGQQLSREVQQRRMAELAAESPPIAKCPTCGTRCQTRSCKRTVTSIDGQVELPEQRGECPVCRRAFFPQMFWNHPDGAEAILQVRAAALCDDRRLAEHLRTRPGSPFTRRPKPPVQKIKS